MIENEYPYAGLSIAHEFINLATPDSWTKFYLAMSQGFGDMWVKQGIDWLDYEFFQQENQWNPIIEKENWNEAHPSYREGISYKEGITESQALMLAEAHDRDAFYGFWFKNVGAWDGYRIGGYLVGSLPDPINFIPLGGGITHLVRAGNATYRSLKSMRFGGLIAEPAKMVGRMSQEGIEASIYTGLATSVIYHKKNVFEQEYGLSDIGMDMAFAFGAGFAIGNFARAGRTFRNWSAGRRQGEIIREGAKLRGVEPEGAGVGGNRNPDDPPLRQEDVPLQNEPDVTPDDVAIVENKKKDLDRQATDNKIDIDNVVGSLIKDRTLIHGWDALVSYIERMGDNFPEIIDKIASCINGRGVGGRRT